MKISFVKPGLPATGIVVVIFGANGKLSNTATRLDKKAGGAIRRAIRASRFEGKCGQSLNIIAPSGTRLDRILLLGHGKSSEVTPLEMQKIGGRIYYGTHKVKNGLVTVVLDTVTKAKMTTAEMAAEIGFGANLRSYRFDKYKTKLKPENKPSIKSLNISCVGYANARKKYLVLSKVASGVFFTRDLVSEPPNILYPDTLARRAKSIK